MTNIDSKGIESKNNVVDLIKDQLNTYLSWVFRREVAAWSALVFYAAIVSKIVFIENTINNSDLNAQIIYLILIIALGVIFFFFVRSQYSQIYYSSAVHSILRKYLVKYFKKGSNTQLYIHYQDIFVNRTEQMEKKLRLNY